MSTSDYHEILAVARAAAKSAGAAIQRHRAAASFTVSIKGQHDMVTTADLEAEKIIIAAIRERFPDHKLLTEEQYPDLADGSVESPLWVIDPIDGTTNYIY